MQVEYERNIINGAPCHKVYEAEVGHALERLQLYANEAPMLPVRQSSTRH